MLMLLIGRGTQLALAVTLYFVIFSYLNASKNHSLMINCSALHSIKRGELVKHKQIIILIIHGMKSDISSKSVHKRFAIFCWNWHKMKQTSFGLLMKLIKTVSPSARSWHASFYRVCYTNDEWCVCACAHYHVVFVILENWINFCIKCVTQL